jgi:hypothetical protein
MNIIRRIVSFGLLGLACMAFSVSAQDQHAQHKGMKPGRIELGTSAAVDAQGRLWVASVEPATGGQATGGYVVLQMSSDMGKTWSPAKRVQQTTEPIEATGESRPKLAFGAKDEIYIAYTKPLAKPFTGEIRFVRSTDGGKTFSPPATVHANRDLITHRFESLIVDREGRLYVAWIDKRDLHAATQKYAGAALYYAVSDDAGATFRGDYKIADHSCECCRIALALDPQGRPVALWRHVFEPNARDHALATLAPDGKVDGFARATHDDWRIDACPHHGPGLAFAADGVRHQVWFNGMEEGGGVFHAAVNASGKLGQARRLGSAQAAHADVVASGREVALAWKEFDGKSTAIVVQLSSDGGQTWQESELLRTQGASDQPRLLNTPAGIVLVWRTQDEGVRVAGLKGMKQ